MKMVLFGHVDLQNGSARCVPSYLVVGLVKGHLMGKTCHLCYQIMDFPSPHIFIYNMKPEGEHLLGSTERKNRVWTFLKMSMFFIKARTATKRETIYKIYNSLRHYHYLLQVPKGSYLNRL